MIDGPVVMVIPPEADTRRLASPVVVNVFVTVPAFASTSMLSFWKLMLTSAEK